MIGTAKAKFCRLRFACELVALILLAHVSLGRAQVIGTHIASGPARLDGPWMVYDGDPPSGPLAFADPRPGRVYFLSDGHSSSQGGNVVWLRATVTPDETLRDPALLINPAADDCEVFVNGQKSADCARWPRTTIFARRWLLVHVPAGPARIAIRIVGPFGGAAIPPRSGEVLFGRTTVLESIRTAWDAARFYQTLPQTLLCVGELLGGVMVLLFFRYDRRRREYLWFAAFLFLDGTMSLESVFNYVYPLLPHATSELTDPLGMIGRYAPLVGFIAAFTGVRLNRLMRGYQLVLLAIPVLMGVPWLNPHLTWLRMPDWSYSWILFPVQLPFVAGSLGFLAWKWRRGNGEAGLLLPSFLLASGIELLGITVSWFRYFRIGRFGYSSDDLSMFFFLVSIGPILLIRHRRISLEHARATAELDAARDIQKRLVPQSIPTITGCRIETAYLPAQEVGGDFYQILAQPDGRVIIAIGDVSGKGLKAAMTGVLVIGALRTLAAEDLGPAKILMRLNAELVRTSDGGFVTCFCAALEPGGTLRIANAGHLAPYRNGEECALDSGLPLGVVDAAEYTETTLQLGPGDTLTFLSDGVVEAQSATGELFGFDRTRVISQRSAEQIAVEAQRFGQQDDITVLTLTRLAAGEESRTEVVTPLLAPA
jgi:hypothetical protein